MNKKTDNELTYKEWEKIIIAIGKRADWITITSGEPFLNKDIDKIVSSVIEHNKPDVICIATNGLLTKQIINKIKKILDSNKKSKTKILLNLSIDGTENLHNKIRGTKNGFKTTLNTIKKLKEMQTDYKKLFIGINSVISKYNVDEFDKILQLINNINPDSYISEIAENRKEFQLFDKKIIPNINNYSKTIRKIINFTEKKDFKPSKITRIIRKIYYNNSINILKRKKQTIPCFAGIASVYINYLGEVWACSSKGEILGNIKETNYDLKKTLFNKKAKQVKKRIKTNGCNCTLANVYYTNIMCDIKNWPKLLKEL
tara:strand:- start:1363 stop:2307 length:945 start_codon:yes stop_codon:yes gene_type:complete